VSITGTLPSSRTLPSNCLETGPEQFPESGPATRRPEVENLPDEELLTSALSASVALVQERLFLGRCLLEIQRRDLWSQWGYSCLNQFLAVGLQMDPREGREARRVAQALEDLPMLAEAAETGRVRWANLREVVRVATPETEEFWTHAALTRRYRPLCRMVRRVLDGGQAADEPEARDSTGTRLNMNLLPEEVELIQAATAALSAQAERMLDPLEAWLDMCRQVVEGRLRTTPDQLQKTREMVAELEVLREEQDLREFQAVAREVADQQRHARVILDPPPGVRTEGVEAGLDARKACIEERSVVGNYVSTAEVRLTTQTGPHRRPNATVGGGFRVMDGGSQVREGELSDGAWEILDRMPGLPWAAAATEEAPIPGDPDLGVAWRSRVPHWDEADARARHPGAAMRRHVLRRDGFRCACPECPHVVWLDIHHVSFYCSGGLTVPENLVLCCSKCHANIHDGNLRVTGNAEEGLTWTDRRGRPLGAWTEAELARAAQEALGRRGWLAGRECAPG